MSSRHFDAFSLWFALGIGRMHRHGQAIILACVHGRLKLREMHVRTAAMRTNRPRGPINKHGSYTHHPRPLPVVVWTQRSSSVGVMRTPAHTLCTQIWVHKNNSGSGRVKTFCGLQRDLRSYPASFYFPFPLLIKFTNPYGIPKVRGREEQ